MPTLPTLPASAAMADRRRPRRYTPFARAGLSVGALLAFALQIGCGAPGPAVRADDTSAANHRREAARENAIADKQQAKYAPGNSLPSPYRDPITNEPDLFYGPTIYNPTDAHLDAADRHRAHARQHEAAARQLEAFEEAQCKDFPPATRAACPLLGPAVALDNIASGVKITFAPTVRVDAVVAHMRCHLAYARTQGFPTESACPLYLKTVDVHREGDTSTVEITSADRTMIARIQKEAKEEVVLRGPKAP
jgi:hypothetical protein